MTWIDLPLNERKTILGNIAEDKGIIENAVEKDFWVSQALRAIFTLPYANALVFKGGTSLSKGWGLIERFSEDIDLAIAPRHLGFDSIETKNQRTKLRKESKKFIYETLAKDLEKELYKLGLGNECRVIAPDTSVSDLDPVVLYVEYNSVLPSHVSYIAEQVKIEISCRSLIEPFELIPMRSMIEDAYPNEDFSMEKVPIATVLPGRTFLEKIFLLHEEFTRPGGCTHIERLTRHMYDIVKMMDKPFAIEAMNNKAMYDEIVAHRRKFTAWSGLDSSTHHPHTLSFIPPASIAKQMKDDYELMKYGFIYADAPEYEDLIAHLEELQERFRKL